MIRIGIDIGSTTVKMVAIDEREAILFSDYQRHNAKATQMATTMLERARLQLGDIDQVSVRLTGSIGMGLARRCGLPFVQEVVAATRAILEDYPHVASMIDIGGEDAKVVFFKDGKATDLRMNGNCAGGTGAFIDQMAIILGIPTDYLNELAMESKQIYPIASRCGVFSKTDIQNLIAKNASRNDIAASIFHAVAVQTVSTLAHGYDIEPPVLFCGGPLTFLPALRQAFIDYLSLREEDILLPKDGTLLPALGTALEEVQEEKIDTLSAFINRMKVEGEKVANLTGMTPIFINDKEYKAWQERISAHPVRNAELCAGIQDAFIGIDSGSTTTKIVVTDTDAQLLYTYYHTNEGNPIAAVEKGLLELKELCEKRGTLLNIIGSCSTGYGEDLIKAAFQLDGGIVETIAHYMAARHWDKDVSFILDIGGQDMKAIFVNKGIIDRIEINEACSSGCGSFVETFAKSLGYTASEFSHSACQADVPCDLGTRCTVFMNSKVKQVLAEGATINDIAAGLAYSVVKNCLYKVLKLTDLSVLGKHVVVQGGTMRNDAVVRAFELLTGLEVTRSNVPELMGALGCALYAAKQRNQARTLEDLIGKAHYHSRPLHCHGCDNQCLVVKYSFANGRTYYSGNRCEKVFTNGTKGGKRVKGENMYLYKQKLLFDRPVIQDDQTSLKIGIPRCLNTFEDYPFWHSLFTHCGLQVRLSDPSTYPAYERHARKVMSDNLCFPAKLVHSHIQDLIDKKVDRIFMPFVVFEHQDGGQNSFNCPIVSGYGEVVKGIPSEGIPIDTPAITFKDEKLLLKQCEEYLEAFGIKPSVVRSAFREAIKAQETFRQELIAHNKLVYRQAKAKNELTILLAGRPYHTDPLIQHKVSELLADMGIHVLTDDIVRAKDVAMDETNFLPQWAYPNRILQAAYWSAKQNANLQFVQFTSFGCGPDAFLIDEVRDMLSRHHKVLTLLKLDDINNVGSMKLRLRSLVDSLRLVEGNKTAATSPQSFNTLPPFDKSRKGYKLLIPYFTPFISPLIPSIVRVAGYDAEGLPMSDADSCEWGLKYANNEVCYPATLIVGDIIKALKSGRYDLQHTAVAMSQTGGQCRASNYVALIKKALVAAGYDQVPVVSLTMADSLENDQSGFEVNWWHILPIAFASVLFSDCIAKFHYASIVRERETGASKRLTEEYLRQGSEIILRNKPSELYKLIGQAARAYSQIIREEAHPQVGVVGEIFLKFNPFAQLEVTDWLIQQGIEAKPPILSEFFLQAFVNSKAWEESHLQPRSWQTTLSGWFYKIVRRQIEKVNEIASIYPYFTPFPDIFEEAKEASKVITLNAQAGEGWLLPAEILGYARQGVNDVISLQPFGCIANQIVSRGVERRIKRICPDMNILSLDFDSGVSVVNITNRMLLFVNKLKQPSTIQ